MGTPPDARRALLRGLIDHAPLFPPASLDLEDALAEDRRARESPHAFALARFVCPASRLAELPRDGRALSVVLDAPFAGGPGVEAVEARYRDDLGALARLAPEVYVEVALDDDLEPRLDELAAHGLRAKVRCGGDAAPGAGDLARFLRGCRERSLVCKATAGLHHAVRTAGEHGLVNLLAAVALGEAEEEVLLEDEPDAFRLDADGLGWRGRTVGAAEIAGARIERLHAVGSCSFFEPIEELGVLGFLPQPVGSP